MTMHSIRVRSRRISWLLCTLIGTAGCLAGCTPSPQDALLGRWYNDAASIRFRPDGTLVYNSPATGLATGRYVFDGNVRPGSAATPVGNLTLDLALQGRVERWQLDMQFLGAERIRLQSITPLRRRRPSDGVATVMILRKAADDAADALTAAR